MIIKVKDKEYSFDGYVDFISIQKLTVETYRQGKTDAIDELLKSDLCTKDEDWDYPCICPSYLYERLEQLKEQNNE